MASAIKDKMRNYYVPGSWNAICDRCGFKFKSHMLLKEWTGLQVCHECWEPRHPQDLIRLSPDNGSVPWTREEPVDTFIEVGTALETEAGDFLMSEINALILTET